MEKKQYIKTNFFLFVISVFILISLLIKELEFKELLKIMGMGALVMLYDTSFITIKLRQYPLCKIFIISFVWTFTVLYIGGGSIKFSVNEFLTVYFFILGITIPFDISDIHKDNIITIPKLLGVNKSKIFAAICLFFSLYLFLSYGNFNLIFVFSWSLACILSCFMILFTNTQKSHFYTRFWIEFCSALPLIGYFILKIKSHF